MRYKSIEKELECQFPWLKDAVITVDIGLREHGAWLGGITLKKKRTIRTP